jgi:ribosomal protein L37E
MQYSALSFFKPMGKRKKLTEGICRMCGKKYKTAFSFGTKFCSSACGSRHWRRVKWYKEGRTTPILMRNKRNTEKNEKETNDSHQRQNQNGN